MKQHATGTDHHPAPEEQLLGYLNFSSGASDPRQHANLDHLYQRLEAAGGEEPAWRAVGAELRRELLRLQNSSAAFDDIEQAEGVLRCAFEHLLPGYLTFHADLLFHQDEQFLMSPFFVGRALEAVLAVGGPWDPQRVVPRALRRLNDYVGHRPLATLESHKIEPYEHEWVRPVPIYIRGAGISHGPHQEVIRIALDLLERAGDDILRMACFDLQLLDELAIDPRAYDFDHPVNKRPNYHFGQWDPHQLDNQGRYRRFVVQQVTLDSLMARLVDAPALPADQLVFEAGAVLAGTMLMAAGVSGDRPETHDSTVTLASLLPRIAHYRDLFYERLFEGLAGPHRERLQAERRERHQPFGGARQHLNAQLARRRASQLEHVQLARIFSRMGYPQAAARQADVVPVASARMRCQIDCMLASGHRALAEGQLAEAAEFAAQSVQRIRQAIDCGAFIDPWNVLGFDAHFSLFPAVENSVHDHRADELIELMEGVFGFHSRIWSEAAAVDDQSICQSIGRQFEALSNWWQQFAMHEVSSVEAVDAGDAYRAAEHVARALNLWHKGGASSGDVGFWAPHVEMFDSPQAYSLVIDALLGRGDFVAAMSLLIHWLGQSDRVPLEAGDSSFHQLAQRWVHELLAATSNEPDDPAKVTSQRAVQLVEKFLDFVEANADQYWRVPVFELGNGRRGEHAAELGADEDDAADAERLFDAAYEEMVYRDTTDDGVEGELFDTGSLPVHDELVHESDRIAGRLAFLSGLASLWRAAVVVQMSGSPHGSHSRSLAQPQAPCRWSAQAQHNRRELMRLLDSVWAHKLPTPSGDHDSMIEYDRQRLVLESLLERIISTCVETVAAGRLLLAATHVPSSPQGANPPPPGADELQALPDDEQQATRMFSSLLAADLLAVRSQWPELLAELARKPLLYVPLSKGGDPRQIVRSRVRQGYIQDLLAWLPRIGLLQETCELIEAARDMERKNPVGPGAVTEFDELFKIGYRAIVEQLVVAAQQWSQPPKPPGRGGRVKRSSSPKRQGKATRKRSATGPASPDSALVTCLEELTEGLLVSWLAHSRTLRLSVLEKVHDNASWSRLVAFVQRYGDQLFTQRFLSLGNVRAILHQGVGQWLRQLKREDSPVDLKLLDELDVCLDRREAEEQLGIVLEAIVENYGEYRDYNSTTTQSDHGELLYTLLDFLRLRSKYDRICWNLKPVVLAHEILVRRGKHEAAEMWRSALADRIGDEADQYIQRLKQLQAKYAMSMPTVADRLAERFVRPMAIDRIKALVEPAIREAQQPPPRPTFELLEQETAELTEVPTGVGLDVPAWLLALDEEVDRVQRPDHQRALEVELERLVPPQPLPFDDALSQLQRWPK